MTSLTCRAVSLSLRTLACRPFGRFTALTSSPAPSFPGKDTEVFREEVPEKGVPIQGGAPTWNCGRMGRFVLGGRWVFVAMAPCRTAVRDWSRLRTRPGLIVLR